MWVKKGKYTPDNMPAIGYRVVSLASLRKRRWKSIKGRFKHGGMMDTIGLIEYIVTASIMYAVALKVAYQWLTKEG